ncbi:sensor histidine kinase [Paenibacillus flagellatus]|uniref:histidine kinase n=1 Tax=Paenibacillus flagellatus TaxID=2211139 RepID=A0A2V5JZ65_9BACL|nr:HAMP domain-containing sensor histidine kinase [Paenibacillus flagellatus]PYI52021.1 sensor histidine kinase [Paenibacillus flagellatus]
MRFHPSRSLLTKYVLIIISALVMVPFALPIVTLLSFAPIQLLEGGVPRPKYPNATELERLWHEEAKRLDGASDAAIDEALRRLKERYAAAELFWVDRTGATRLQLPPNPSIPPAWTPGYTVQFMKERVDADPFTVVAFIGGDPKQGFMTLAIHRADIRPEGQRMREHYAKIFAVGSAAILGGFLFLSLVFFNRIRRRLVRLQEAMTSDSGNGLPGTIHVQNDDEIGRLESTFNQMVRKLERSRLREAEEEALRKDLIAKLSHDLRTPLTAIRGHAYSLRGEPLSERGRGSIDLIERKIDYLGQLIENLFSYTLLSSGKYPYRPRQVDIVRTAKTLFAGWYPAFEQAGFDIESDLPDAPVYWEADTEWLERVLDNYFQNVLRHAKSGRYIYLGVSADDEGSIRIADRGPGMGGESAEKGAGLGLTIIALMLKEMNLRQEIESSAEGTTVAIRPKRPPVRGWAAD